MSRTHSFTIIFIVVINGTLCCQPLSNSDLFWPEITQEIKPWSRWWWQGSGVTREGISAELEAYKASGIGGLELTPIYGVIGEEEEFIEYLSPEWMDMLEYTLQEAQRLGLGMDMATGTGWPFGGPWVMEDDASKYLVYTTYDLQGGQKMNDPITFIQEGFVRAISNQVYQQYEKYQDLGKEMVPSRPLPEFVEVENKPLTPSDLIQPISQNDNLQVLALDQVRFDEELKLVSLIAFSKEGEMVNLGDKVDHEGILDWTAPIGSWKLYAVFQGLHGKMVERAAPGGEGAVIDHFSTEAIQHYLARFDSAFAGRDVSGLRAFFNDSYEVDDARGQANWTPQFLEVFENKHGYDLQAYWPALFGDEQSEIHQRVLSDYRETISDLLLITFTKEWGTWAKNYGKVIRNQAHGAPANILDLYAASDIPETEGTELIRIKFATSAAHVAGKKLASAEAATWLNEHFTSNLAELKQNLDQYLVGGVNHILYHGTCYSPPEDPWPGRLFYAAIHANPRNTLWQDFATLNQYIARTQSFLQAGKSHNDILLYLPAYDRFATPQRELLDHFDGHGPSLEGTPFEENAQTLLNRGFAFDYISDKQILQLALKDGILQTGGASYQTILIPETRFIPLGTMQKLTQLAQGGVTVIFHKELPLDVPGLSKLAARQEAYQNMLSEWKFNSISDKIDAAKVGKGQFLRGENIEELLNYLGVQRESMVDEGLKYIRRIHDEEKTYFITNWSDSKVEGWIPLQFNSDEIIVVDPMKGKKGKAKSRDTGDGLEAYLQFEKGSSLILTTAFHAQETEPWQYFEKTDKVVSLEKPWKIEFITGGPELPADATVDKLDSWTKIEGEPYRNFSGTARYIFEFEKPEVEGEGWLLDLGQVHESAVVRLNSHEIGTLIGPVYQINIPIELIQDQNTLEIEVSNLMANRIADLDRRDIFWKKFYNINFPPRTAENRGKYGLFDASNWEPMPSGLIGPVNMYVLNKKYL